MRINGWYIVLAIVLGLIVAKYGNCQLNQKDAQAITDILNQASPGTTVTHGEVPLDISTLPAIPVLGATIVQAVKGKGLQCSENGSGWHDCTCAQLEGLIDAPVPPIVDHDIPESHAVGTIPYSNIDNRIPPVPGEVKVLIYREGHWDMIGHSYPVPQPK